MSSLVIGGSGFVGSHLLAALTDAGAPVVGASRSGRRGLAAGLGVPFERCDVTDLGQVRRLLGRLRPRVIYQLAALALPGACEEDPVQAFACNALGTYHVARVAGELDYPVRLVLVSSAKVGDPHEPPAAYAASKLAGEALAREVCGRAELIVARPFQHFGPGQSDAYFIGSVARQLAEAEAASERSRRRPRVLVGNLDVRRSLSPVGDIVSAYIALAAHGIPGGAYRVAAMQPRPLEEYLETLRELSDVEIDVEVDPARVRGGELDTPTISTRKLRHDTGWEPTVPLEQALEETLEHWRAQVARARR
jgi:GDP-4-dehydro-6-deoxy-D-mannose reductase